MRKLWLVFSLILSSSLISVELEPWRITKNVPPFSYSAEFAIKQKGVTLATVMRTGLFTPQYCYDLYDANRQPQLRGLTRTWSWGQLFDWAIEIDLYEKENHIGSILGEWITHSRAKFGFYDKEGNLMASAHLNDESTNFLILSAQGGDSIIAELDGKTYGDSSVWEMKFATAFPAIDQRFLQLFAGFVCDYQKSFLRPPKHVHHYYTERPSKESSR